MKLIQTLILTLICCCAFAQGISIKGKVIDENNAGVMYATVILKNASDSSLYKGEITNESGEYVFQDIRNGNYFMQVQAVGFENAFKQSINATSGEIRIDDIKLKPAMKQLNAVNVTGEKPFIERQADKMVVNVENSIIHAGSSVLEVFEKMPGVMVDQNGNIRLRGKQGVIILIDGKPTTLSGQDLVNMLNGMSAANIQQIEIITNPSAKWDAAGNAGILNIIMKKNKLEGYNGSVNLNYGQGRYPKMTTSASINYKKDRWNLFFNYSFSKRKGFNNLLIDRKFYSNGSLEEQFLTNNYIWVNTASHNPRLGADYSILNNTTLSVLTSAVIGNYNPTTSNHSDIYDQDHTKIYTLDFSQDSKFNYQNYEFNSQINHKFDTLGQSIVVNLDYGHYDGNSDMNFSTLRNDLVNKLSDIIYLTGSENGGLQLYSFKADYSKPLKNDFSLESGIKSSQVESDKDMRFYNGTNDEESFDSAKSSHFIYKENINAAYISLQKKIDKLTVQAGLRGEQTVANGDQKLSGQAFDRNYFQVFPTVYLSYTSNKHTINANIGRRINRPGYEQMDPYKRLIDYTTFAEGNPYLLPELTYVTELSYSYDDSYFVTFNYSHTVQSINDILIQDAATHTTIQSIVNLNKLEYYSLDLTYSKRITAWWKTNTDFLGYYANYLGEVIGYSIDEGGPSFSFSTSNSFTITDKLSGELSYRFDYQNWYGVTLSRNSSSLTAGLQYSILDKRGTITTNITDILWNAYPKGFTDFGDVTEDWISKRDTRVFNIGFTYNFGKGKASRMRRNTGADEEKRRIG